MNRKTLVKYLDVTLVRTLTTLEDVQHHLADAKQYKYRSVVLTTTILNVIQQQAISNWAAAK